MDVLSERAAGLDVHKDSVTACVMVGPATGPIAREIREFGTTTNALLELRDWLESFDVQVVAMEATGVYWRPVFNVLQHDAAADGEASGLRLILANPMHIKNVPGRKTDVKDADWIAQLARHGLIQASFVPPRPIREMRDLARYRKKLVRDLSAEKNRIQKVLEDANIKLGSVATDILGKSARAMLEDIIKGDNDAAKLAAQAKGKMRKKVHALTEALTGKPTKAHRFLLKEILSHIDYLTAAITKIEAELEERLAVHDDLSERLQTIPGVGEACAAAIVAELGTDMSVFPSSHHAASWAGLSPGSFESAGKKSPLAP